MTTVMDKLIDLDTAAPEDVLTDSDGVKYVKNGEERECPLPYATLAHQMLPPHYSLAVGRLKKVPSSVTLSRSPKPSCQDRRPFLSPPDH